MTKKERNRLAKICSKRYCDKLPKDQVIVYKDMHYGVGMEIRSINNFEYGNEIKNKSVYVIEKFNKYGLLTIKNKTKSHLKKVVKTISMCLLSLSEKNYNCFIFSNCDHSLANDHFKIFLKSLTFGLDSSPTYCPSILHFL